LEGRRTGGAGEWEGQANGGPIAADQSAESAARFGASAIAASNVSRLPHGESWTPAATSRKWQRLISVLLIAVAAVTGFFFMLISWAVTFLSAVRLVAGFRLGDGNRIASRCSDVATRPASPARRSRAEILLACRASWRIFAA
jgi:hypothetical protein